MGAKDVIVRPADPEDVAAMMAVRQSAEQWAAEQGVTDVTISTKELRSFPNDWYKRVAEKCRDWSQKALRLFVAEVDGAVVGWAIAGMRAPCYYPSTDLSQLFLGPFYVHRDHMKDGVGKRIIAYLKQDAIEHKVQVIRTECTTGIRVEYFKSQEFVPVPYDGNRKDYANEKYQMLEMDL